MSEHSAPAKRRIRASVRAAPDVGEGRVEALVSDYSITYDIGWGWSERIAPGAFADSIAANPTIPICWEHDWGNGPIGHGEASEHDMGLIVRGEMYLDLDPQVARIWRSMKAGAVNEWSIAFFPERIVNDEAEKYVDIIEKGDLVEATSCFRGANPGTETLDLRGRAVYIDGGEAAAQKEVVRLRKLFSVPDLEWKASGRDYGLSAATANGVTTGGDVTHRHTVMPPVASSAGSLSIADAAGQQWLYRSDTNSPNINIGVAGGILTPPAPVASDREKIEAAVLALRVALRADDDVNTKVSAIDAMVDELMSLLGIPDPDSDETADSDDGAATRADHGSMDGTHTHSHPAMGSQGDDETHEHEHSHSGDADHDHHAGASSSSRLLSTRWGFDLVRDELASRSSRFPATSSPPKEGADA